MILLSIFGGGPLSFLVVGKFSLSNVLLHTCIDFYCLLYPLVVSRVIHFLRFHLYSQSHRVLNDWEYKSRLMVLVYMNAAVQWATTMLKVEGLSVFPPTCYPPRRWSRFWLDQARHQRGPWQRDHAVTQCLLLLPSAS